MKGDYRESFKLIPEESGLPLSLLRRISACANTCGGTVNIDIDAGADESREEIREYLTKEISREIYPDPMEFIEMDSFRDCVVMYVDVGCDRPYCIDSKGLTPRGTYKTEDGACMPRNIREIENLQDESGLPFDTFMSIQQHLTFSEAGKFCKGFIHEDPRLRTEGGRMNNLALLLSDQNPFRIKLNEYGSDSVSMFTGSVFRALSEAFDAADAAMSPSVSRDAVREALVNAVLHRDYRMGGDIDVVCYADHVRVSSPGGAPEGVSPEAVRMGLSVQRNPGLAGIFSSYGLAPGCGTGIRKMLALAGTAPEVMLEVGDTAFAVNIYSDDPDRIELSSSRPGFYGRDDEADTYMFVKEKGSVSRHDIEEAFGFGQTKAYSILKKLSEEGKIVQKKQGKLSYYSTPFEYED